MQPRSRDARLRCPIATLAGVRYSGPEALLLRERSRQKTRSNAVLKIYRYGDLGIKSKLVIDHLGVVIDHFARGKSKTCRGSTEGPGGVEIGPGLPESASS